MPHYDYRCDACRHEFEAFQQMSAPALEACPECRKPKLRRLLGGGGGLLFRGSGFYQTDYKEKPAAPCGEGGCAPAGGG
ncbi:MAG: zinc ribbon domain-containing protein [Planctomycetes bacterium]|nr:zinc ribbon domain-containing protein [Planctomycetota bacterium]MBL7008695.1 zinc ribbon domain-containing protein [Planctomycetota bacterium]